MLARHRRLPESWRQTLPMEVFLRAAFDRRLGFLTPLEAVGENATIAVETAIANCWNERCRGKTQIITSIEIATDQGAFDFSLPDLTHHPHLLVEILQRLPSSFDRKVIQERYSHTQRRSYVSNGCAKCNRLFGEFMVAHEPSEIDQIATFPARLDSRWLALLGSHPDIEISQPAWWVRA
jgi:competence protein CoiA